MKHAFGWGNVCYLKQNVASRPVPRNNISPRTRDLIEQHNEFDMQLFEYAEELFEEKILAYGPRFEKDLRAFERKNERYFGKKGLWQKAKDWVLKAVSAVFR